MKARQPEPEQPRAVQRSWDNAELRHRIEGHQIEGIDVLALQSSVVAREAATPRRRRLRSR